MRARADTKSYLLLGGTVLLGLLLRGWMFSGYVGGDDSAYITQAYLYYTGAMLPPVDHWGLRGLLVLLTAASFSLFGINAFAVGFFPMVVSLSGIFVAYGLGRFAGRTETGLMAAFLVAIFPMEVIFGSHLFPYAFLSVLCSACLLAFMVGERSGRPILFLVCGLLLGMAYLARETALFCGLFFMAWIISERRIKPAWLLAPLGFAIVFAVECAFYAQIAGHPLYRLQTLAGLGGERSDTIGEVTKSAYLSLQWWVEPFIRPIAEQEIGLYFLVFLVAAVRLALRQRENRWLLLWIVPILAYTVYGTVSPSEYLPLRRLPRYLSPVVLPMLTVIAVFLLNLEGRWLRRAVIGALLLSTVASFLVDVSPIVTDRERRIAEFIDAHPDRRFIVPRPLMFEVAFYRGFKGWDNMALYARDKDRSHGLERLQRLRPNLPRAVPADLQCGEMVVVDGQYLTLDALPADLAGVEAFPAPPSFKDWLLRQEAAVAVLSLVRDPKRLRDLTEDRSNDSQFRVFQRDCPAEQA